MQIADGDADPHAWIVLSISPLPTSRKTTVAANGVEVAVRSARADEERVLTSSITLIIGFLSVSPSAPMDAVGVGCTRRQRRHGQRTDGLDESAEVSPSRLRRRLIPDALPLAWRHLFVLQVRGHVGGGPAGLGA